MSKNINQSNLYRDFKIPPNRANIRLSGPMDSVSGVNTKFLQMGLTAADLTPIDWRRKVNLSPIMNQQNCGDCWAMSSTSALADRFIIQNNIRNLRLEPAITAQCAQPDQIDQGCQGGDPYRAGKFFESTGVPSVDNTCKSWGKLCMPSNCILESCQDLTYMCKDSVFYRAISNSTTNLTIKGQNSIDVETTISNIKRELLNGPVVAAFFVPKDFMASVIYKWKATNGIFINGAYNDILDRLASDKLKNNLGITNSSHWADIILEKGNPSGHAVSIVGWDRGNAGPYGDVSYWIVRNSWGSDWNEDGYFRIAMNDSGLNENLGFDIPVANLIISSTNELRPLGEFYGGCVSFDPDLMTGAPRGTIYSGPKSHEVKVWVILLIVFTVLIAGGLGYYFWIRKVKIGNMNNYNINQITEILPKSME